MGHNHQITDAPVQELLLVLVILAVHTSADGTLRGARPMGAFFRGGSPPKEGRGPPPPTPLRGARPTPET